MKIFDSFFIILGIFFLVANKQFARAYIDFQYRVTKRKYDIKLVRVLTILISSLMIIFVIFKWLTE